MSDAAYRRSHPPARLDRFPADLANPALEYSGVYEDGWMANRGYFVLAGGPHTRLRIRAQVLPQAKSLQVLVNGRQVAFRTVGAGRLDLRVPVSGARGKRRVELRWGGSVPLAAPDLRPASALLQYVGLDRARR